MIRFLRYLLRRTVLFACIAGLAYVTVFTIFPYIDDRLPFLVAVLCTYILLAYGVIPAAIRVLRIFDKPNRIPTCAMTGDGWPSDPVNVAILARSETDFVRAFQQAGWQRADSPTLKNILRIVWAIIANRPYPTAPFSSLYLFGRRQDYGFQITVGGSPRRRHHIRFWQVTPESLMNTDVVSQQHHIFWLDLLSSFWRKEQRLWVGACIYDSGPIDIMWRNGQLNHRVHPNADYEREFVMTTLREAGVLVSMREVRSGEPYRRWGQGLQGKIISDGQVHLCTIKPCKITSA